MGIKDYSFNEKSENFGLTTNPGLTKICCHSFLLLFFYILAAQKAKLREHQSLCEVLLHFEEKKITTLEVKYKEN